VPAGPTTDLLVPHLGTVEAVAALLGCEAGWRSPTADDQPAGALPAQHPAVSALVGQHPATAAAVTQLLTV